MAPELQDGRGAAVEAKPGEIRMQHFNPISCSYHCIENTDYVTNPHISPRVKRYRWHAAPERGVSRMAHLSTGAAHPSNPSGRNRPVSGMPLDSMSTNPVRALHTPSHTCLTPASSPYTTTWISAPLRPPRCCMLMHFPSAALPSRRNPRSQPSASPRENSPKARFRQHSTSRWCKMGPLLSQSRIGRYRAVNGPWNRHLSNDK